GVPQKTIRIDVRCDGREWRAGAAARPRAGAGRLPQSELVSAVVSCDVLRRERAPEGRKLILHPIPPGNGVPAAEQAQVVQEEAAVQMVELVLQAACEKARCVHLEGISLQIQAAHANRGRTLHLAENLRYREA